MYHIMKGISTEICWFILILICHLGSIPQFYIWFCYFLRDVRFHCHFDQELRIGKKYWVMLFVLVCRNNIFIQSSTHARFWLSCFFFNCHIHKERNPSKLAATAKKSFVAKDDDLFCPPRMAMYKHNLAIEQDCIWATPRL